MNVFLPPVNPVEKTNGQENPQYKHPKKLNRVSHGRHLPFPPVERGELKTKMK